MPSNAAQWLWFAFFVVGTFGGWVFIGYLIWRMRIGEVRSLRDLEVENERLNTVNKTLSKMTRDLMEDVKRADATARMMQEEIGKLKGVPDGQQG
jgi:uncharacterized membrane-anchored protein YhcB (DUF1043 family)